MFVLLARAMTILRPGTETKVNFLIIQLVGVNVVNLFVMRRIHYEAVQ
jgi:hypothetical protein